MIVDAADDIMLKLPICFCQDHLPKSADFASWLSSDKTGVCSSKIVQRTEQKNMDGCIICNLIHGSARVVFLWGGDNISYTGACLISDFSDILAHVA